MNWQPLISRWRVEADRRRRQLDTGRGAQTVAWATEQAAIISTLLKCADQAEKSLKRQKLRERKAQHVEAGKRVFPQVRVTKAPDPDEPSKW